MEHHPSVSKTLSLENVTLITIYRPNMHKQTLLFQPLKTTIQYKTFCDQRILIKFIALYCNTFVQMKHNSVHNEPVTHPVTESDSSAKRCELSPAASAVPPPLVYYAGTCTSASTMQWQFGTRASFSVQASNRDGSAASSAKLTRSSSAYIICLAR